MARGMGRIQRTVLAIIRHYRKPMTFAQIHSVILQSLGAARDTQSVETVPDTQLPKSLQRSIRRALHQLTGSRALIAISGGGMAEPYRYFIHPVLIGMIGNKREARAL